jgi:hypothetical protein
MPGTICIASDSDKPSVQPYVGESTPAFSGISRGEDDRLSGNTIVPYLHAQTRGAECKNSTGRLFTRQIEYRHCASIVAYLALVPLDHLIRPSQVKFQTYERPNPIVQVLQFLHRGLWKHCNSCIPKRPRIFTFFVFADQASF